MRTLSHPDPTGEGDVHGDFHAVSKMPWGSQLCARCDLEHEQVGVVELDGEQVGTISTWRPSAEATDLPLTLITISDLDDVPMSPAAAQLLGELLIIAADRAHLATEYRLLCAMAPPERRDDT